jgi:Flp pilus assembly protein protease CpaA
MIAIAVTLLLTISLRIGGGDFKLFSLLLISQGQLVFSREYFEILTLCIFASLLLTTLHALRRNFRLGGSIPLAPAILAPFTVIYLDI